MIMSEKSLMDVESLRSVGEGPITMPGLIDTSIHRLCWPAISHASFSWWCCGRAGRRA